MAPLPRSSGRPRKFFRSHSDQGRPSDDSRSFDVVTVMREGDRRRSHWPDSEAWSSASTLNNHRAAFGIGQASTRQCARGTTASNVSPQNTGQPRSSTPTPPAKGPRPLNRAQSISTQGHPPQLLPSTEDPTSRGHSRMPVGASTITNWHYPASHRRNGLASFAEEVPVTTPERTRPPPTIPPAVKDLYDFELMPHAYISAPAIEDAPNLAEDPFPSRPSSLGPLSRPSSTTYFAVGDPPVTEDAAKAEDSVPSRPGSLRRLSDPSSTKFSAVWDLGLWEERRGADSNASSRSPSRQGSPEIGSYKGETVESGSSSLSDFPSSSIWVSQHSQQEQNTEKEPGLSSSHFFTSHFFTSHFFTSHFFTSRSNPTHERVSTPPPTTQRAATSQTEEQDANKTAPIPNPMYEPEAQAAWINKNLRTFVLASVPHLDPEAVPISSDDLVVGLCEHLIHRSTLSQLLIGVKHNFRVKRSAMQLDESYLLPLLETVLDSTKLRDQVEKLRGGDAERFLAVIANFCDQAPTHAINAATLSKARRLHLRLSSSSNHVDPQSFVHGISLLRKDPAFGGGFSDVYHGTLGGLSVALKRLRVYQTSELNKLQNKICQEASVWRHLQHPHILEFIGIDATTFEDIGVMAMVSPWMDNGSLVQYMKTAALSSEEADTLMYEVAQGLAFLHSKTMVHGDLRGANVLIDADGVAYLSDFGLTRFMESTMRTHTTNQDGSPQWMAPELFDPSILFQRTYASDVYAFACVCVEAFTGLPPYGTTFVGVLQIEVARGQRPNRPSRLSLVGLEMSDELWFIVERCWVHAPAQRPTMPDVLRLMEAMDSIEPGSIPV